MAQKKRGHVDKLAGLAAGQGRGHGFYRGAGLFRVARILPVEMLRAKFEIATNVRLRGPSRDLWGPKPSVHLATPRKNSFDRGGFRKTREDLRLHQLSTIGLARATGPCQSAER